MPDPRKKVCAEDKPEKQSKCIAQHTLVFRKLFRLHILAVHAHATAALIMFARKGVNRRIINAAVCMIVTLAWPTVVSVQLISSPERLVVVQRQAPLALKEMRTKVRNHWLWCPIHWTHKFLWALKPRKLHFVTAN